jgi:hypothetical protein
MLSPRKLLPLILTPLIAAALAVAFMPSETEGNVLRDVNGVSHGSLDHRPDGEWTLLVFLTTDCPIANQYAPEIQRICTSYGEKGVRCFLVYVDPSLPPETLKQHKLDFGFDCCDAILDKQHALVRKAGATVSSEAAVFSSRGTLEYRGRIDDLYAELGTRRQTANRHDLREALDALTAGRRVLIPRTETFGCFISDLSEAGKWSNGLR